MPLKKISLKPGVNRENTRYTNEGGWYDCDKIRFRQGTPEKIGGWVPATTFGYNYQGVARSMWPWTTNNSFPYLGVGTNLKYYIVSGGVYNDITPLRVPATAPGDVTFLPAYSTLSAPITATALSITVAAGANFPASGGAVILIGTEQIRYDTRAGNVLTLLSIAGRGYNGSTAAAHSSGDGVGSYTLTVLDNAFGSSAGDFVTFSGATTLGGNIVAAVLNQNYQIASVLTVNSYTITTAAATSILDTLPGGTITVGAYEIPVGYPISVSLFGWGAGTWGAGPWGTGTTSASPIRIWNAQNFGQDLIYGPKGGAIYYWSTTGSPLTTRGVALSSLSGASNVPLMQNLLLVSDTSRFVFAFGTNDYGLTEQDPMLIRWSDQESAVNWTPAATNQAGSIRLSHGSAIIAVAQTRQEILVWTDTSLYSLQYVGAPIVWSSTLLTDNISILSDRAWATASGKTYWMGVDKFYVYEGSTSTLVCDLRQYIFDDLPGINNAQNAQIFSSTVEKFNEVWWFYCSHDSTVANRYAVFNYTEKLWYYGTMIRTAWIDSSVINHLPIAADDVNKKLMYQETGTDDVSTNTAVPITSFITSSEFDLDDGNNFAFIWRMLPDVTFRGSDPEINPSLIMYLLPLANSGSGYTVNTGTDANHSVADQSSATVTRTAIIPVEQFTGIVYTRVRGRQLSIKVQSNTLGVQWQLGSPRLDIKPDGRR